MKYFLLLTTLLYSFTTFSQSTNGTGEPSNDDQGFYISIGTGYGFPMGSKLLGKNQISAEIIKSTGVYSSFGEGIYFNLSPGFIFSDHVGIELGLSYLKSSPVYTSKAFYFTSSTIFESNKLEAQMLQVKPSLFLRTKAGKLTPFVKFGAIIGYGDFKSNYLHTSFRNNKMDMTEIIKEYKPAISFGVTSALGADWSINKNISLFSEVLINMISYKPEKAEVIKYEIDGEDKLAERPLSFRETDFVKEEEFQFFPTGDEPSKQLAEYYPFSSIGLNLGMRFMF